MADRVLFQCWGEPVHGREQHSLEVFNEALAYYGEMQSAGRIESFDVCLLEPNGFLDGYIAVKGSSEQLHALKEDVRFRRITAEAGMIVNQLRHIEGYTGDGIGEIMPLYEEAIAKAPQMALH
jgi:hypothetical protein